MKIWHPKIVRALPQTDLLSTWRGVAIISKKILTKQPIPASNLFIYKYPFDHFISYSKEIEEELKKRKYSVFPYVFQGIEKLKPDWKRIPIEDMYKEIMTNDYLIDNYNFLMNKYPYEEDIPKFCQTRLNKIMEGLL